MSFDETPPRGGEAGSTCQPNKFLDGLTPFNDFARAIKKHPKTVKKLNPPIVYVGRTPYVPDAEGRQWVFNGCRPPPLRTNRGRGKHPAPAREGA
jgi:hypothetical protein